MFNLPTTLDVPLRFEEDGSIRVGQTRVLLELVIHAFLDGETPEGILAMYDVLRLADVYMVIGYYLNHRTAIDAYLAQVEAEGEEIRKWLEARNPDAAFIRERLLKRLEEKERQRLSAVLE